MAKSQEPTRKRNMQAATAAKKAVKKKTTKKAATKKKTKKKKKRVCWDQLNAREAEQDSLFRKMYDSQVAEFGYSEGETVMGDEAVKLVLGIPMPALSCRYLVQNVVWPLSRVTQIVGEEGTCKTSFFNEIMRWHLVYGGFGMVKENESKDSPDLRTMIMQHNYKYLRRIRIDFTKSLEDWMRKLKRNVVGAQRMMTGTSKEPGPGRIMPWFFGVDSLMATAAEENVKKVDTDGAPDRGHPLEALKMSRYMQVLPQKLARWPFSVVGTNHLKPSTDARGFPVKNIPGGKSIKFMETFQFCMFRGADINRIDDGGVRLKIRADKNGLGPSRREIEVDLLWWWEELPDGDGVVEKRKVAVWDWTAASIMLLISFKANATMWKRINAIVDINFNKTNRTMWSKTLGIPEKSPAPYTRAGEILETRLDLLDELYYILGITKRPHFQPGVDYRKAVDEAESASEAAMHERYGTYDGMPKMSGEELPDTFAAPTKAAAQDVADDE